MNVHSSIICHDQKWKQSTCQSCVIYPVSGLCRQWIITHEVMKLELLFQILKDDVMKVLHSICQQIWKKQWPQDWKRSVFIPIPKKDNAKECTNYHIIALIQLRNGEMHAHLWVSSITKSSHVFLWWQCHVKSPGTYVICFPHLQHLSSSYSSGFSICSIHIYSSAHPFISFIHIYLE